MVRWSPPPPRDVEHFPSLGGHDPVSLSLFVACVAATVAIASTMCSACGRKPKAVSQEPDAAGDANASDASGSQQGGAGGKEEEEVVTLPPDLGTHGPIEAAPLPKSASRRKLSVSMSMGVGKSMSMGVGKSIANIPDKIKQSKRELRGKEKDDPEDTLWKKSIILGEKCKIPGERDAEASDPDAAADAADEMTAGAFRRSSYSRPVSRSNSFSVHQPLPEPPAMQSYSKS
ncbi:hypothetical protein D1007_55818 [Hordeum vulgare]|uniref:Uncharacterized protein n=1 Tax=Hordeum vulgare subsp. vulgare TaxID=112509 RepID=A0A8I6YZH3_HORVV|nr:uncharacterized protein LOC123412016 [Hordeum vulgare subsp. vulgare]KAE8772232.1 hypothetical protein D1007_55818 [Hordeum vulgare]